MNPAIREFLRAAADGDIGRVRALLVQGADVNSTNAAGQTALILATAFQHIEVVELLLKANASIEHQDELGLTAFDWAKPAPQILKLLDDPPRPVVQPEPTPVIEAPFHPTSEPEDFVNETTPVIPTDGPVTSEDEPIGTPVAPIQRLRFAPTVPTGEEPALKGLAAAILRDHKPRVIEPNSENSFPEVHVSHVPDVIPDIKVDVPTPHEPTPLYEVATQESAEANDDTIDGPIETSDDTLAGKSRPVSRSSIFDLNAPEEPLRSISKVQVKVPPTSNGSRNGVIVWLLVIVVLAAGGYGGYRLASSLLATRTQPANTTDPPATAAQPKVEISKRAPVVSGDFAGAELYLPDAKYPSEATVQDATVSVEVRVSRKGIVVGARAMDGDESLRAAAEEAAKSSAFSPEKLEDRAALMTGTITYHFNASFKAPTISTENDKDEEVTATIGGPLAGTELKLVHPTRPKSFKDTDAEDVVTIVIRVNRSGRVVSWRPLEGTRELRAVAVQAAKQSTFSPDKLPDTGDVVGTITYNFH